MIYSKSHSDEQIKEDIQKLLKRKIECAMNEKRAEHELDSANRKLLRTREDLMSVDLGLNDAVRELALREYQAGDKP